MFYSRRVFRVLAVFLLIVIIQLSPALSAGDSGSTPRTTLRTLGTPTGGYWTGPVGGALPSTIPPSAFAKGEAVGSLPSSFSWSGWNGEKAAGTNYMTPVKDQGDCGSCWAFAAVGDMEAQYQISKRNPKTGIDLSEQNVLQCSGGSCSGWYADSTLNFLKDSGTPDEGCNPYAATDHPCGTDRCSDYLSRTYYITDWTFISTDTDTIKSHLRNHGPVMVWMPVFDDFPWWDADFWVANFYSHPPDSCDGCGHFVVIVGWNDQGTTNGYWIVRNSWGTGGGDVLEGQGGYFYMDMNPTNGFFGINQEAAIISGVTPPSVTPPTPTGFKVDVIAKTALGDEFSGLKVKADKKSYTTPFSLTLQGKHTFTAPKTAKISGVTYGFVDWEDETGATVSTRASLTYDVQSDKTFYAVYKLPSYTLTVYAYDARTRKPIADASVYLDEDVGLFVGLTDLRGKLVVKDVTAGTYDLEIIMDGYVDYTATISITKNTTHKAYLSMT